MNNKPCDVKFQCWYLRMLAFALLTPVQWKESEGGNNKESEDLGWR